MTDALALAPEEKLELLELLQLRDKRIRSNMLAAYKPYAKQRDFHAAGATHRERLFMAGNQLGKCSLPDSLVDTPSGPVKVKQLRGGDTVLAWDGDRKVAAEILQPFQKPGLHDCALIVMSDGRTFGAADEHQVLFADGWKRISQCLPESFFYRPQSIPECGLSAHASGARSWIGKVAGWLARCLTGRRQCDGQLPPAPSTGQVPTPLQDDALPRTCHSGRSDASGSTETGSPLSPQSRPSSRDVVLRIWGRCVAWLAQAEHRFSGPSLLTRLALPLLRVAAACALRSSGAVSLLTRDASLSKTWPWEIPDVDGNHIIAVIPIGRHKVYDFTVPGLHNYCGAGLVHHNTVAGAYEVAMHVTGRYPDWWKGRRFPRATRWIVGSETAELTKKGIQRLLLGPPEKKEEWGYGAIPRECIHDTSPRTGVPDAVSSIVVKHELGENSVIQMSSYEQGRTKWQADTVDGFWCDEEPPLEIYSEALTRTQATQGMGFVTFTPLLGMSQVVKRFLREKPEGTTVVYMTIDDAEHYTQDQRDKIIAAYPEHEREARARGIPIMGSGLVFPIAESTIRVDAFPIPMHWGRVNAWDFGWGHRAAWVALAHDRDTDTVYVYDCWAAKETPVMTQAGIITARGLSTIPHAWPHDGLQHDKGSGDQLAAQYRKHGINMIGERAQFEPTADGKPGGNSLEAGIGMMMTRFQARQLRVFSHLNDWFEEFRGYHRKDGVIVKIDDDVISATRYGLMMLRKAKSLAEISPHQARRFGAVSMPAWAPFDPTVGY